MRVEHGENRASGGSSGGDRARGRGDQPASSGAGLDRRLPRRARPSSATSSRTPVATPIDPFHGTRGACARARRRRRRCTSRPGDRLGRRRHGQRSRRPRWSGSETALGLVPAGSGNGLAASLGVPRDARRRLRRNPARARPRRIDVGYLGGRPFFNIAGIGLDAHIADEFGRRGAGPSRPSGRTSASAYAQAWQYASRHYELELDGHSRQTVGAARRLRQRA